MSERTPVDPLDNKIAVLMNATRIDTASTRELNALVDFQNAVKRFRIEYDKVAQIENTISKANFSKETKDVLKKELEETSQAASLYVQSAELILDSGVLDQVYIRARNRIEQEMRTSIQIKRDNEIRRESHKTVETRFHAVLAIIMLIATIFIVVIALQEPDNSSSSNKPPVQQNLTEIVYTNGQMINRPDGECICPLEVSVRGSSGYYVYMKYRGSSSNDIAFMIKPGCTVEIDVPLGYYEFYYATGETWYGLHNKFGDNTRYYKADTVLEFSQDSQYVYGHTLELWEQTGGNMDEVPIGESDFPG